MSAPNFFAGMATVRNVEPQKRMVAGRYGWAIHRFPIRGGKTYKETAWAEHMCKLASNITRENILFRRLVSGG